ncbi:hypothetical protein TNCT_554561 [Trichonephila clavata]|uniref:Uncharacterized protein n=1 Tax=Trichonephila clavata TaxID=2740835 RepID=A0A8X6IPC7_TRICU|nr:hypothetical protein TNCT_554561 [Trichonephila clavata]
MEVDEEVRVPLETEHLESFALNLFSASTCKFGLRAPDQIFPSPFQSEDIIHAVVCLQFYMRDTLRKCFSESMSLVESLNREKISVEIVERILAQMRPYYDGDIFNFTLSNLALMAELLLYLRHVDVSVSLFWFVRIWVFTYRCRLQKKLEEAGGWMELIRTAKERYTLSGIYKEISEEFQNLTHPYQSFNVHHGAKHVYFAVESVSAARMARATTALQIMRWIYSRNPILGRRRMWHELNFVQRQRGEERHLEVVEQDEQQVEVVPEREEEQAQAAEMQVEQQEASLTDEDGWC